MVSVCCSVFVAMVLFGHYVGVAMGRDDHVYRLCDVLRSPVRRLQVQEVDHVSDCRALHVRVPHTTNQGASL